MTDLTQAARQATDVADPILPPHPEHGWTWTDAEIRFLLAWAADYARRCVEQATREQAEHRAALEAQQEPVAYCSPESLKWATHGSETVVKLTRKAQPQHGFTAPLYDAPQPAHPPAQPQGWVLVPESALRWLFGEEGEFECPPERYFRGKPPTYWWRGVFRDMLAARPKETT